MDWGIGEIYPVHGEKRMSSKGTYIRPIIQEIDEETGTSTNAWASVKSDLYFTKGYTRKMFIIDNTHAANGLKYRILGSREESAGVLTDPKVVIPETVIPALQDPEVETFGDPWKFMDLQVKSAVDDSHATYAVECELYSV